MTKFYMLVGLPASGKSSVSKILQEDDLTIFSSDELRKELWGNEGTQGDNTELFKELHNRIKTSLENEKGCVYDATNISSKRRMAFLREISKIKNIEKNCILMLTDYDVCLENNKKRERFVPEDVIKRMYLTFEIPQYREGWDNILLIRNRDKNKNYSFRELMDYMRTVPHDNPYHLLTIGDHMCAAANYVAKTFQTSINTTKLNLIYEAAFFHDIGKPFTKEFKNNKGEDCEIAHYYNHEYVSAYMYLLYCEPSEILFDLEGCLYVADLIQLHMKMFNRDTEKSKQRLINLIGEEKYNALCVLHEADTVCK